MLSEPRPSEQSFLGSRVTAEGTSFRVWAPFANNVSLRICSSEAAEELRLTRGSDGYFHRTFSHVFNSARYFYHLDSKLLLPDPASRFQPEGVHGPSQIVNTGEFIWSDREWKGISLEDFIIYELHTGTFSREGTFSSLIPYLDYLVDLGITALELMPVSQFPGGRNWGYDSVFPYAPQNTYGGPDGLQKLVNAAHHKGIAVILDVIYNHLGPEGNCLHHYGPYFTDTYRSPWGKALNFDGPCSDEVRQYFISNALYWIGEYHIDALRLDAVHAIYDFSAHHFLDELKKSVETLAAALDRKIYLIAETSRNDTRIINPRSQGGYSIDCQWNDDFHHALHTILTGEREGYYEDYGKLDHLEKAFREGFVYTGQYSRYRKRRHGNDSSANPASQFVVFSQCHDQVGNRRKGDRLAGLLSQKQLRLAAGVVLLSPYIPLLFMGEEYGETAPFLYFISHSDETLVEAVREGRKKEFAAFRWEGDVPDPQAETTFLTSKLNLERSLSGNQNQLFSFTRQLIKLRKTVPAFRHLDKKSQEVRILGADQALLVRRWYREDEVIIIYNFGDEALEIESGSIGNRPLGKLLLYSASSYWESREEGEREKGADQEEAPSPTLSPQSFAVYEIMNEE